ncbi:MAG TPA: alpha/beta fold hydrolase [Gemmataceae bacterium]|nr:alpha/beta fold hydrolase [Gemmataceae bacterium]
MNRFQAILTGCMIALQAAPGFGANYPAPVEGDFILPNFRFQSGESLPELKLHYRTIGTAQKNARGVVHNAVLILHGTGGSGTSLLRPSFADVLFGPGKLLDASRYYLILPDGIGHGRSSKPSDGLHARFPHYNYADMVLAQYRLLTERLSVGHLRLVMGTSMGGMHTWVWGETYPEFMDALMPLASLPVEIAGRNRMQRRMILDAIRKDPDWHNGEYREQPRGLATAVEFLILMGSSPLQMQKMAPTRVAADKLLEDQVRTRLKGLDANDLLYQVDASRDYNPAPDLGKIKAPLLAINSADDEINPPELGILEREIQRVPHGRMVLIPISDETRGHGTHTYAEIWKAHLAELLEASKRE